MNKFSVGTAVISIFSIFVILGNVSLVSAGYSPLNMSTDSVTNTAIPTPIETPEPLTHRQIVENKKYTYNHWALYWWDNGYLACNIFQEESNQPTYEKIQFSCGSKVAQAWQFTSACESPLRLESCSGLYIKYLGEVYSEVQEVLNIALPSVEVNLVNCNPWGDCDAPPRLSFIGFEPINGEHITSIYVKIGSNQYNCRNSPCIIEMPQTDELGENVEYWADSSFGDNSAHYEFVMRNIRIQDQVYRFEILADKWADDTAACTLIWNVFPEYLGSYPPWLAKVNDVSMLATNHDFAWLGGYMIRKGYVEADACFDNGLLINGNASTCGLETIGPDLVKWQNQYDELIFSAAIESNIPPRLIKGLIAQESQFYATSSTEGEFGLGMLTEEGLDLVLTWNTQYFLEKCIAVYGEGACEGGYSSLLEEDRAVLRGYVFKEIGTETEISLIAKTLSAACGQTGQIVQNITLNRLDKVITYTDLWKLTLSIYNAGAGCLIGPIENAWDKDKNLNWSNIANQLSPGCELAEDYVNKVVFLGLPKENERH